jgi:hypothetical protein
LLQIREAFALRPVDLDAAWQQKGNIDFYLSQVLCHK